MTQRTWNVDAKGVWEIDRAHFPTPLSPWFREIMPVAFPRGFKEATERVGLLMSHIEPQFVNGFMYMQPVIVGAPRGAKSLPPKFIFKAMSALHPAVRRRVKAQSTVFDRRPWRDDLELWRKQVRTQATATHLELQATDPAKLDDNALAAWLDKLFANATEQYYNHHRFTITVVMPVGDFIAHVEEWTGMSPGEAIQALRQDHGVVTDESERFAALVGALRDDASLARHLDNGDPAEALRLIAADRGRVGAALRAYFELTEHRLVTGYDVTDLTTGEMPGLVVRSLRAALAGAKPQGAADREQLRTTIRDRVPEKHRALYDQLLGDATEISNLREERALVCDFWAFGLARRALKEAGRRLAAAGLLVDADHIFDASLAEQKALLGRAAAPSKSELADRAAWRTSATADDAPQYIGGTPPAPPPVDWYPASAQRSVRATEAVMRCLFAEGVAAKEPKLVRGLNASSGIYEGRARVVLKPEHFPRIEQGDVLIARCTTEAYNGIIPLLGAVVTDRGGVLSHAATVAREFGIPAVVGTQNATQTIPDGARVRVDGTRGEARLV